jgi:hypothetical protein
MMLFHFSRLHRDRARTLQGIRQRRQQISRLGRECQQQGLAWARTPQAPVQVFVAGFLLDQLRPLLPMTTSPLKLALLVASNRLQAFLASEKSP